MSKLVSRWADDDSLVQEALKQDSKVPTPGTSPSKSITVKRNEALPSRWADAEDEPIPVPVLEPIVKSPRKHNHGHRQQRREEERREDRGARHEKSYPTPPNSKDEKTSPQRSKKHFERKQEHKSDTEYEEGLDEKGPMTDAAKAFAARLGIPSGGYDKSTRKPESSSDDWEDDEEEEVIAKPLRSKMGKLSINEKKKPHPHKQKEMGKYKPPNKSKSESETSNKRKEQEMTEEEKEDLVKMIEEIKAAGTSSWADEE
ncbi:hypothetical protein JA1_004154 [Spathaspora sp. JA1]|nr:hypothetical protein JA1_004154 [Spathaspora sp. JA1]